MTPKNPTAIAAQRRQPTRSPKNRAAPSVTTSGVACKIADAEDSGVSTIAVTKQTVPTISPPARTKTGVLTIARSNNARPCIRTMAPNTTDPPHPSTTRIWPTGKSSPISLMKLSSTAKPSMDSTIKRAPRKLSIAVFQPVVSPG